MKCLNCLKLKSLSNLGSMNVSYAVNGGFQFEVCRFLADLWFVWIFMISCRNKLCFYFWWLVFFWCIYTDHYWAKFRNGLTLMLINMINIFIYDEIYPHTINKIIWRLLSRLKSSHYSMLLTYFSNSFKQFAHN